MSPQPTTPAAMNIVLTGFMGTGKTTVAQIVARRLGRPLLDMDLEIEARAVKSVAEIFGQEGEGRFRQMEADLCRELATRQGLVIATGGGALVNPDNRRRMIASGPVFCLTAGVDEILRRVASAQGRPLLEVGDRKAEIERLLARRKGAYDAIPRQVDTTSRTAEEVAEQVIAEATSILLPVHYPGGSYPIHIAPGLLSQLGRLVGEETEGSRIAVVTNPTVAALHLEPALESLREAALSPFVCTMPDGERYKTLDTLERLYTAFVQGGLDRGGTVLALGGGVVCDVAGLAAATYMRGVPIVQVPTTLLAMVDASVGGKTAVDLPQGKNLVGAFKQPALVAIDPDVLRTLPPEELASGMAELIKHSVLADAELFQELEQGQPNPAAWPRWIARSLQVKIHVVEQDPFERGLRAVLNLGHTTGHALEQISGYRLRHGDGVSLGLIAAARIAVQVGLAEPSLPSRIAGVLAAYGLPVGPLHEVEALCGEAGSCDAGAIWEAMGRDKKKRGRTLRWILPRRIGQVEIVADVPPAIVLDVLREMGAE
jgi:shikimate kinase/3-dehydroquinate synthase